MVSSLLRYGSFPQPGNLHRGNPRSGKVAETGMWCQSAASIATVAFK